MRKVTWLSFATLLALAACGSNEPGAEEKKADAPASAGSVLRIDPAIDEIVPANAVIEKLAGGFIFTEGPVWVAAGGPHLLFSDVPGNAIYRWNPDGAISDFLKPVFSGEVEEGRYVGSNGLTLDAQDRLVACEHGARRVSRLSPEGNLETLADRFEGKRLNSPNDLVYKSDGSLYFTDPPYGLPKQDDDPAKELDFNGIFRLTADGNLHLLGRGQTRPNGIGFSPDEKTLYVANSDPDRKQWMAYPVNADGTLGDGRVFYDVQGESAGGLPDGLKLDKKGNLYATGPGGVWIFTPEGKHLGTIQPEEIPANCGWGDDGKTLYMTARTGIYRIKLNAEGALP